MENNIHHLKKIISSMLISIHFVMSHATVTDFSIQIMSENIVFDKFLIFTYVNFYNYVLQLQDGNIATILQKCI